MHRISIGLVLAALTCAPLARAQTPEERASARVLVEQADKKLGEKDFQAAVDLFAKAFLVVPAPTIRLAQARAEVRLGRLIAAQQHMLEAARSPAQAGQPPGVGGLRGGWRRDGSSLARGRKRLSILRHGYFQVPFSITRSMAWVWALSSVRFAG